jgi:protein-S-isoprenylcysteine O-methyltransferase Ste14
MNHISALAVFSACWILFEAAFALRTHSSEAPGERCDRGSLPLFWAVAAITCMLGWIFAQQSVGTIAAPALFWIGLALIVVGIVIRWIAILTLRRFFTVSVTIREGHQLIRHGIYSIIRHPAYIGWIVSYIGIGLALRNWLSFTAILIATIIGFGYRIRVEEHALTARFGVEYSDYAARTKRLIPGIY